VSGADEEMSATDKALMKALAEAIGGLQPPIDLATRSEGLIAWLDVDAELAELLEQPMTEAAGIRGSSAATPVLEFTVADGSCVVEVSVVDDAISGQLLGGEADEVGLRTSAGAVSSAPIDELGAFTFINPPSGAVRLEIDLRQGRRIHTDWFTV
jgi:hypothetical protein